MTWDASRSLQQLRDAVDTFDRPEVTALCAELIERLHNDDASYPELGAADILGQLRRKRHFTLLQQVADALIQAGADRPVVRRQYSQAMLDQGNLTASVAVLQRLVTDTADLPGENAEARGLLGRAYKQMYIATGPGAPARRRLHIDRAVASYYDVYCESGNLWHGINVSALLARAARDGVAPSRFPNPAESARAIAKRVLGQIEARGDSADTWDRATAVEACVALSRAEDALAWLDSYLQAAGTDAFQLASMLRQLTDVWQLNADADPGARLLPVLQATLLKSQDGEELLIGPADVDSTTLGRIDSQTGFEKILGTDRFTNLTWFRTALERCRAVGRVEDIFQGGVGTGFLVAGPSLHPSLPEKVFVTNAHVVSAEVPDALDPEEARVTFRAIERSGNDPTYYRIAKMLWCSLPHKLDTTIATLDGYPLEASLCPVATRRPRMDPPPQTFIIGHPSGTEQLMLSIRDNLVLGGDETRIHYRTPTLGGSSGSPVFNAVWQVIALHHAGRTDMPKLDGQGTYAANEGIWLDRIRTELQTALAP
jgi:hypothetical protein